MRQVGVKHCLWWISFSGDKNTQLAVTQRHSMDPRRAIQWASAYFPFPQELVTSQENNYAVCWWNAASDTEMKVRQQQLSIVSTRSVEQMRRLRYEFAAMVEWFLPPFTGKHGVITFITVNWQPRITDEQINNMRVKILFADSSIRPTRTGNALALPHPVISLIVFRT